MKISPEKDTRAACSTWPAIDKTSLERRLSPSANSPIVKDFPMARDVEAIGKSLFYSKRLILIDRSLFLHRRLKRYHQIF